MPSKRHVFGILLVTACLAASLVSPATATAATASPGAETADRSASAACGSGLGSSGTPADESDNLSIDTLVAPGAHYDRLTDADALATAREAGTLTPASEGVYLTWEDELVAYRDSTVHRIALNGSATGLLDRLAAQDRGSPTENFRALVAGDDAEFDYIGATACPPQLALNASIERGAIRVVPDRENGALFLVLDTDRLLFHPLGGGEPTTDTYVKGHHGLTFTLRASSGLVAENATVESHYDVMDARAEFAAENEGLAVVAPDGGQIVRGRTTLAPGSEIEVTLHPYAADGDALTATATVNRSREFAAEFDLSNASAGTSYAAAVTEVTEPPFVEAGATLVAVGNASAALVDVSDYDADRPVSTLHPMAVTTTDGGFVTVHDDSGTLLGVSEYLDPGAATARPEFSPPLIEDKIVTVTVYRDANGNREFDDGDEPYRVHGTVVRDSAAVRVDADPVTTATTRTTVPGSTTDETTTGRPLAEEPTSTTDDRGRPSASGRTDRPPAAGVPGFGFGVTVVALVAAVALAVARR